MMAWYGMVTAPRFCDGTVKHATGRERQTSLGAETAGLALTEFMLVNFSFLSQLFTVAELLLPGLQPLGSKTINSC